MDLDDDSGNDEAEDEPANGEDDEDADEEGPDQEETTEQDSSAAKQQVSGIQQGISMLTTGKVCMTRDSMGSAYEVNQCGT